MPVAKHIYLLRHAKSSWDDPELADRDRPLAPRGRRACALMAAYLSQHEIHPELILCSPATRTVQTLEGVYPQTGDGDWTYPGGEVSYELGLYGASAAALIGRLRELPPEIDSVMVVGHNPAMRILALTLAQAVGESDGPNPSEAAWLEQIGQKLPTGALVSLETASDWTEIGHSRAQIADYVRPKLLGNT